MSEYDTSSTFDKVGNSDTVMAEEEGNSFEELDKDIHRRSHPVYHFKAEPVRDDLIAFLRRRTRK